MVIDVLKDRIEIGKNPELDELDTEEKIQRFMLKAIGEAMRASSRAESVAQACGHSMVDLLVHDIEVYKDDPRMLEERASVIKTVVRAYAKRIGSNPDSLINGFLAETVTCIALKQSGYIVLSPTQVEDLHYGIDMYAIDPNAKEKEDKKVLVIQVKASSELDGPFVQRLGESEKGLGLFLGRQQMADVDSFMKRLDESKEKMLQYLSKERNLFGENEAVPLLIMIPCGIYCDASVVNLRNGSPIKGFKWKLYDMMEPLVYKERE